MNGGIFMTTTNDLPQFFSSTDDFPQFFSSDNESQPTVIKRPLCDLSNFKDGDNVLFMRPRKALQVDIDKNKIHILCQTEGYGNKIVQTHETQMNQFIKADDKNGTMEIEITFWSDSIFRVRFAENNLTEKINNQSPLQNEMLIGKPVENLYLHVEETQDQIIAKTDLLSVQIQKQPFNIKAYDKDNKLIFEQQRYELYTSDTFDMSIAKIANKTACFESFSLSNTEEIFGLGERFDYVGRRGKQVDFWNKDAIGTSSTRTYINVPFWFSTKGYGMFLNSTAKTEWEIGTREFCSASVGIDDEFMDYFIIYGPSPSEILYKYCTLTGFAPTPPIWSFGLWMSRNSYLSWDVVHEVADGIRERNIPCDVLHLDTAWFHEDWNCDLRFSKERFPNPEENMKNLKEKGFYISLWQYNFLPPRSNNINYVEALEKGYLALGKDGKPYAYPKDAKGSWIDDVIIDFSNEDAVKWYSQQIEDLINMGAGAIKVDFGEGIPEDAIYKNIDGSKFHNLYSLLYTKAIANATYKARGENIVWTRSGTAGSQRYPLHWGGDSQCSWAGLAGTVKGALSIGLSGFPFFAHDIGGFLGRPTPELYIRWSQFGLFSSHSRCHGCGNENSREPWNFGAEAERIFKKYATLRYRLLPYIYNEAKKSSTTGKPLVKALIFE
jgi:alpha-D-xyloside xylohydrolase